MGILNCTDVQKAYEVCVVRENDGRIWAKCQDEMVMLAKKGEVSFKRKVTVEGRRKKENC